MYVSLDSNKMTYEEAKLVVDSYLSQSSTWGISYPHSPSHDFFFENTSGERFRDYFDA